MIKHMFSFCFTCLLLGATANAAEIDLFDTAGGATLVTVSGEIRNGDSDVFIWRTLGLRNASVLFDSLGGSLIDGLEIGRAIRRKGFATGVAPQTACSSACALAWLGGTTRFMHPTALIGFHAAYLEQDGVAVESGAANALVGAYLNQLGLGAEAIYFTTSAAPSEMNWLNAAQAREVGIQFILLEVDGIENNAKGRIELNLPTGFRWIVLESGESSSALRYAEFADVVVLTSNGYFASALGPFEQRLAEDLIVTSSELPEDAYLSSGNGFLFAVD